MENTLGLSVAWSLGIYPKDPCTGTDFQIKGGDTKQRISKEVA
jgi:hypothetical protein